MSAVRTITRGRGGWSAFVAVGIWAVCTAIVINALASPRRTSLDIDEVYWIGSTYYYHLAFERGDAHDAAWRLLPAAENPPVAKYVLGAGLALAGQHVTSLDLLGAFYLAFEGVPGAWGSGRDYERRLAVVQAMTPEVRTRIAAAGNLTVAPELFVPARVTALICAAAASLGVLFLGRWTAGWVGGLFASQLVLLHPAIAAAYVRAESDSVALALAVGTAVFGVCWLKRLRGGGVTVISVGSAITWSFGGGVLMALACAAKMNAAVVVLATGLAALLVFGEAIARGRRMHATRIALALVVAGCSGLAAFVAVNPATWGDIASGVAATVLEHRHTEQLQAQFLGDHLDSLGQKVSAVVHLGLIHPVVAAALLLMAVATLVLGNASQRYLACWWLLAAIAVTLWIPFARERYVVPVALPSALLVAIAVSAMWERGRRLPALRRATSSSGAAGAGGEP